MKLVLLSFHYLYPVNVIILLDVNYISTRKLQGNNYLGIGFGKFNNKNGDIILHAIFDKNENFLQTI